MSEPLAPKNFVAQPVHVVDGFAKGPNGRPLSRFAEFANRMRSGWHVPYAEPVTVFSDDMILQAQADGSILFLRNDGTSGTVRELAVDDE